MLRPNPNPRARRGLLAMAFAVGTLLPVSAQAFDIQQVTSPQGIEAWLIETHHVPVISISFAFAGGSAHDPAGKEGLAHLVSYLLDEGAGDLDSAAFQSRLNDLAIDLTFDDAVDHFYGEMKTVTANADAAFDLLRLALTEPRFDADPVERMRSAVRSEIARRTGDPDWIARRVFFETAYPDHQYGRPSRGTVASVDGLTVDDLRGFVADRFARDTLLVGVTGDITPEELGIRLDEVFGALPETGHVPTLAAVEPATGDTLIRVDRPGPQSVMLVAQPGIDRDDPDYFAARVMNQVLGASGLNSRLGGEIREARGLTYGISSYFVNFQSSDLLMVGSSLSNDNVSEALEVLQAEWRRMAEDGVTTEELEDARTFLTGSFALSFTSTDRIANQLLAMQIYDLGIDYLDTRNDQIDSVTIEDVQRVAADLLDTGALTTVVVGMPDDGFQPTDTIDAADIVARELDDGGSG